MKKKSLSREELKKEIEIKEQKLKELISNNPELTELDKGILADIFEKDKITIDSQIYLTEVCGNSNLKDANWLEVKESTEKLKKGYIKEIKINDKKWFKLTEKGRIIGELINQIEYLKQEIVKLKSKKEEEKVEETREKIPETQAIEIINLTQKNIESFFVDEVGTPFCALKIEDHFETVPLNSKKFKNFLAGLLWDYKRMPANPSAINSAIMVLENQTIKTREITLNNRVGKSNDKILFDLGDKKWRYVEITSEGWKIKKEPAILFRRYKHQKPIFKVYLSNKNCNLNNLIELINLKNKDYILLLKVYIVSLLIPDIPHPILILYGEKGSAKSTAFKLIRALIDNSATLVLSLPKDKTEFVQQLSHHYMPYYDNLSKLSDGQSDILCRAVTGEGFSKRELYSDDEDIIYNYRRCIGLNGINIPAIQSDLLDRSLIIEFEKIRKSERKKEEGTWKKFEEIMSGVFGDILTILSKALAIKDKIKLDNLPRMADFCEWGEAISQAMGEKPMKFYYTYMRNVNQQSKEAIEGNSLGQAILELLKEEGYFKGTPSELYATLNKIGDDLGLTKERDWPKAANSLTRKLNLIKSNLEELGIIVDKGKSGDRYITIISSKLSNSPNNRENESKPKNTADSIKDDTLENIVQDKRNIIDENQKKGQQDDKDNIPLNFISQKDLDKSANQKSKTRILRDIIEKLHKESRDNLANKEEIIKQAREEYKEYGYKDTVEENIKKGLREGWLDEPKSEFLRVV